MCGVSDILLLQINIYKTTKSAKMGFQRVTPHCVGRCHEVTKGTWRLAYYPFGGEVCEGLPLPVVGDVSLMTGVAGPD